MYGGQGNYTPQFRQVPPGPPPPYQQVLPGPPPPPFVQPPPGPSIHSLGQQASSYYGQSAAPLSQQPVHFPPPPPVNSSQLSQQVPYPSSQYSQQQPHPPPPPANSSQYSQQLQHPPAPLPLPPPPPPPQTNVGAPVVPPYPMSGFSVPMPMPNSIANFGMQQPLPPRILQPTPQHQTQGQVSFRSPHPPHPGMLHAPPAPPWPINVPAPPPAPPPPFDLTIPASFIGQHPPSVPSTPPPPPPPPPSSPPPLPPSPPPPVPVPASDGFPTDSIEGFRTNSNIDSEAREHRNASVHVAYTTRDRREGTMIPIDDEEASENCALPPPRPDEAVVRNMEVLCQFIAKVGPDFENTARAKEAGNPKFDFLFGGEPGSVAAIGHEYFQWMKKKYITDSKLSKGLKHNVLPICNLKDEISSQPGVGRLDLRHSPATSDMDMEDDISTADIGNGFSNTNNEYRVSTNARAYTSNNVKEQLHDEICFASGTSSPITSLIDAEDEKESSVYEDVSPDRCSPDTTCPDDGRHAASRLPSMDSINGKVSPINNDAKSQEASGVYLKFGSPFRLIQDYASDESDNENVRSDNENVRSDNEEGSNPVSPRATTTVTSCLQQEKQSGSCLNFGGQDLSTDGNEYGYYTTSFQLSALGLQVAVSSPDKSVPLTSNFGTMGKNVDPGYHQDENMLNYRSEASRPSSEYDVSDGRKNDTDQEFEMFHSKKSLTAEQNPSHDVDEFGRLVRKGASGSDSDRSQHDEKSTKRGRSRSKSLSRSPRGSRRRRRSRSPRRRDNRSRSRSLSPKRRRSKSPQSFRSNILARRGRDLPPDCFNFIRGRCFYGASCRFLHRDSGPPNMQQRYQDSRRPRYLHNSDSMSFSRSSYHDKSDVTEFHAERCDKLVEADDIINRISFDKLLDGRDKPVPTPEVEDVSNLVPLKMTPEAEDVSILVPQEVIPETEDASILVTQEMTPAAEDSSNLVFREMISEEENASMLVSKKMTPVPEDSSNLDSYEMTLEVKDGSNPVFLEIIRAEQDSPVVEVPFTSVDEEPIQPISDSPKPLHTDNMSVQSPTSKSVFSNHDVIEQPGAGNTFFLKVSESNTVASAFEAEKSSEHDSPVETRTSQSKTVPIQASTSEVDVGEDIAMEETANLNTTSAYLRSHTSMESSALPPNKDFFPPNLLVSGSSLPLPPPPPEGQHTLPLPPPPPTQGQHAMPLPPPPPTHGQRLMHISNDSSSGIFSSQRFRENILPPMTSYQSQLSPEPFMFYPQRPLLPSNLQSNQLNLPWSDQHMLPLHGRPPFPSSEASQLHHQHNSFPQRNDFIPLSRPYPPNEVASSRQSDFYSQTFLSAPSVHPPRHLSFPVEQGGVHVQNQGLMMPSSSMPLLRSLLGDRVDPRAYPREEFSTPHLRDIRQPLYNQPNPASFGTSGMMHPLIQKYTENNFQSHPSDVSASRFPIKEHYNPYASAFEQPRVGDPSIPGPQIRRYDLSLSADNDSIVGFGYGMRPSPMSARRLGEQLPRTGNYVHESSAEMIPDTKKELVQEPVSGAPYDPLFDSIEPSSGASKLRVEEQNSGVNDTGSASKRRATKVGSKKNREGVSTELKAEVDEMGEVATDADAGGVENESPQLLDKDWSPLIPFDAGDTNVGEVEINQVRSPSKSKKNKDSRSMKLFKVAVADFAKEVLKPSWRQGNLSKEAFKTIVKKTVDKVAGAVPTHQVPKSQAKINQYMDSSQRKLTKLVMGYVDKYIKM